MVFKEAYEKHVDLRYIVFRSEVNFVVVFVCFLWLCNLIVVPTHLSPDVFCASLFLLCLL